MNIYSFMGLAILQATLTFMTWRIILKGTTIWEEVIVVFCLIFAMYLGFYGSHKTNQKVEE